MPNIKSAKKRVKVSATKTAQNKMAKTALKTTLKGFYATIANEPEKATEVMKVTQKAVDQAVANGLMHKNTAARKKSAMAKAVAAAK